jgi:serine/threonine-protein kinase HipA
MSLDVRSVQCADVYKAGRFAATLQRVNGGTEFSYLATYDGPPVATTLPRTTDPFITPAGAVPAFFAGLLPEGRRFSSLQRAIKTSADDELSLLLAVGSDTIGDVVIVPHGDSTSREASLVTVDTNFDEIHFSDLMSDAGIVDKVGLPGIQEKVSARVISLPLSTPTDRFILKLNPPEFPHVVENEAFFLELARSAGLPVVDATLVYDNTGTAGLLVRRFDRASSSESEPKSIACEDACQLLNLWPSDKYNVSSEALTHRVFDLCASSSVAIRDVFRQLCFAWITGNGDVHAKNISLLEHASNEWRVAPAYDLPSTLFYGDYSMALSIDDRTTGLSRRRWLEFAHSIGLAQKAAERVIDHLLAATIDLSSVIRGGVLPFDDKTNRDSARNIANRQKQLAA